MIDQRVIDKLKKKDESAFEYVYQETKRGVYSMIFSIAKNHQVTEDIMQDVYMKMMMTIDQFKSQSNFNNWILTMAKHQAIDYYRKEKRIIHIDQTDYDKVLTSSGPSPEEATQFDVMINMLNENQRTVVLLKIVYGTKFKDIAVLLDKPVGTVIWLYHEAIKTLKKYEGS